MDNGSILRLYDAVRKRGFSGIVDENERLGES